MPFGRTDSKGAVRLLSERQQAQLAAIATRVRLKSRAILYREGAPANWVFIVSDGVMKSYRDLPSGRRRVMAFLFNDDIFGLAERGAYVNTAQAVTPVTVYRMHLEPLADILQNDAALQYQVLCKITHALRESQRQTIAIARRHAVSRLVMFLHMLEEHTGAPRTDKARIDIPMSRSDAASFLGLTLETVSRASRALEKHGIVSFSGAHTARVLDREQFRKLALAE